MQEEMIAAAEEFYQSVCSFCNNCLILSISRVFIKSLGA